VKNRSKKGQRVGVKIRKSKWSSRSLAERLEPRLLLAMNPVDISIPSGEQSAILSALGPGLSGQFVSAGLEISLATSPNGYTPEYVMLDPTPQLGPDGVLSPYSTTGPTGLTATQVRHAYGIDSVMFGAVHGDGTGQTIAIVDAYDYPTITADLHAFDVAFGLADPPSVTKVNETGGSTLPGVDPAGKGNDWEVEEALDVEWSHAMAPGANIVLVEATSPTDQDLIQNAVNTARNLPGVVAVTMSFGRSENSSDTSLDPYFTTPTGHGGVTFLASTGDSGAPGGFPSFSSNVVAVGGTTLHVDASGNYQSETGWSSGGGGISVYEPQPGYQKGVVTQSTTQRTIPDISFDADPATGVSVYDSYDFGTTVPWLTVGGTSLSSPSWAGIVAVIDQGMGSTSLDGINQTLPLLYKLPASDFHDITSGSNGYSAGPGYDLVTGIGTPITTNLIPGIIAAANPTLHVIASTPAPGGSVFGTPPTSFSLTLSSAADVGTVVRNDFSVNGVTPNAVTLDPSGTILTLNYASSPVSSPGNQTISVTNGAIDRLSDESPITAFSSTFIYAPTQLQVVSSTPNATTEAVLPFMTMTVNFSGPVNPSSVSATNLSLSQGSVTNAVLMPGNTSVTYTISGVTTEEFVTASIAAGALTDQYGAACAAFAVTFATHSVSNPLPTATSIAPLGSWLYQTTGTGVVGTTTDTELFTVSLNAGENLSIVVHPTSSGLTPSVSLLSPSSSVLASASAGGAGQDAVIQTVPITVAGSYTIQVSGSGTTVGAFSVQALLNGAVEMAEHNGASDTTLGTAQNIDAAFNTMGGSAAIASVVGALGVTAHDYYALTLSAGQLISVALTAIPGSGAPLLYLYNSIGAVQATGVSGATNVSSDISSFVAPSSGVYYVRVDGTITGYSLVVTKNAAFSLQPNGTLGSAQNLAQNQPVFGYVSASGGSTVLESFDSGNLNSYTFTGANNVSVTAAAAHDGPYGLSANTALTDWFYRTDAGAQTSSGETISVWVRDTSTTESGRAYFGIGAGAGGQYAIVMATNTGQFLIQQDLAGGFSDIASASQTWQANTWYRMAISWQTGGTLVGTLYASDGVTVLNTITASNTGITPGGISFRAFGDAFNLDTATVVGSTPAVSYYAINLTAGNPVSLETFTPSSGAGQFTDTLNPGIYLYNSGGTPLASNVNGAPDGRNALLTYNPATSGTYLVEVQPNPAGKTSGEYMLSEGPGLSLSLPANENKGVGAVNGTIIATIAPTSDLTINLVSSDPTRLSVPTTVILKAGQTSVALPMNFPDDHLLDGPELVTVTASATGYFTSSGVVDVHDNQTATLSVTLPSNAVKGQGSISGTVYTSAAPAHNIVVQLASSASSEISVPATVTLLAGQTSVNFNATVLQDTIIDGTQSVTVSASVENWTSGSTTVSVADDNNTIKVSLPTSGWEGQTLTNAGTVTLGGTLTNNLLVNLQSSNPSELSVPATVTVLAGQTTATFNVTLINDGVKHAPLAEMVTASASGLTSGSGSIVVNDSLLDHLTFASLTGPKTAGTPFGVTVTAYNSSGQQIADYGGALTLSAKGNGGAEPVTPTVGTFSNGIWSTNVTLTAADPGVTLTVGSGGVSGVSNSVAVQPGSVATLQWGSISGPKIANVPFAETITAMDGYGNVATNFNGSAALSGSVGTTTSANLLGSVPAPPYAYNFGTFTIGYTFTPSSNIQVTAVRSYGGTKVEIWTSSGTLLVSQPVSGPNGQWTQTPLTTPITLTGGSAYLIATYTAGQTYYGSMSLGSASPLGTLNLGYEASGDSFPTISDSWRWIYVDLVANISTGTAVSIAPTTATFINGVWSGNITVPQPETAMHLHADDGTGQTGDSSTFDVIQRTLSIIAPTDMTEGEGTIQGALDVNPSPTSSLTVTLTSSDPSRLTVPSTITIQPGQTSVVLPITVIATGQLDSLENVTISATASGYSTGNANVNVHSGQSATLTVSLPSQVSEGAGTVVGTVYASAAPTQNITIKLSDSNSGQATVPATVVLLAGQTSATFNVSVLDNKIIEGGPNGVTIGASVDNWISGYASMLVQDIDNTIAVSLPASAWEGQNPGNGTVTLGGTSTSNLVVSLTSSNSSDLIVPSTITIPAGQTSATFTVTIPSNSVMEGLRTDTVTASASGLPMGAGAIVVHDSTPDYLGFGTISGPATDGVALPVTIHAYNISNEVIAGYSGTATLSASGSGGAIAVTPSTVTFSAGTWTGSVTLNTVDPAVKLTANAGGGVIGVSNSFAVQAGAVSGFKWSSIPSTETQNVPFSETITAVDVNGYTATYNGTAAFSGLVGSSTSMEILNNLTPNGTATTLETVGYSFTPNSNVQITAVRSYWGSKVEIWTNTGTLLLSQAVTGTPGTWTQTQLTTPLALTAGKTYVVAAFTTGTAYFNTVSPTASFAWGTMNGGLASTSDGFPTLQNIYTYLVDVVASVGNFSAVPTTPTSATFVNGTWTGNVTVAQAETGMHLHVDDGAGHTSDSSTFNVLLQPSVTLPQAPTNLVYDGTSDVTNWVVPVLHGVAGQPAPTGAVTLKYYNGSSATGTALPSAPVNAGQYTVVASYAGDSNYGPAQSAATTFTVAQAAVTVTLPTPPPSITYDGTTDVLNWVNASVTGPSGAPAPTGGITYVYYAGSMATGTALTAPPTGPGPFTVVAQYLGNSNYLAGSSAATTFTISGSTAPLSMGFKVDDGTAQRSMVRSLTVTFSAAVTLQAGAITLTDNMGNPIPFTLSTSDQTNYVLTFAGSQFVGGSLANGRYILTVHSSNVNGSGGAQLAADQTLNFWRLFGDFYGTASVNNADKALFTQVYKGLNPAYSSYFDYDGNGILNSTDVSAFNLDFGKSI
jgi:hypothetical protein